MSSATRSLFCLDLNMLNVDCKYLNPGVLSLIPVIAWNDINNKHAITSPMKCGDALSSNHMQNSYTWGRDQMTDIFLIILSDICSFLNENFWISIRISLKFVPDGPIINTPVLFQIISWRRPSDKPLSEQMMILLTHICVTRPQWNE